MKKILSGVIAFTMILSSITYTHAVTDEMIFNDQIRQIYAGRAEAIDMINNLDFDDLPENHWAKEAIIRNGALNIIKGYDDNYNPDAHITNQEALAMILRALGMENRAQQQAVAVQGMLPENSPLRTQWAIGYINVAMQIGLISNYDYLDSLADQAGLNPNYSFIYGAPVTRQQFAAWLVTGLRTARPTLFTSNASRQKIFEYSDWDKIDADKIEAVEALAVGGVMTGVMGQFLPNGNVSRAEAAYIFKSLDLSYYEMQNIEKRTGTVGGFKNARTDTTAAMSLARDIYVRTSYGYVDVLRNYVAASTAPKLTILDAPIYKDGKIAGLSALEEGDMIEYLVRPPTNEVLYVQVLEPTPAEERTVRGPLISADTTIGTITIDDETGMHYTFPMADGVYSSEDGINYIFIDKKRRELSSIPRHSTVELYLVNDICTEIRYIGEPAAIDEYQGIVIENNVDFGYLAVVDNLGRQVIQQFYESDLYVKKRQYYDTSDTIGYISQVFPNFSYNPLETSIYEIEPGDIVFIRPNPDDPSIISEISAATNYIAKYGKILQFMPVGDYFEMLVEYENKQTSWLTVPDGIFATRAGRPITTQDIVPGDWAKVLVNQALISPGYVLESVKELTVENEGHHISNIYKGQLAGIDSVQNQLLVQNVQQLTKTGWTNYRNADKFSLSGKDIEFYHDGKRISQDYALKYFKRADNEVYIALENNYAGAKVKKVTFRSGRDELLGADTVIQAGSAGFSILSNTGIIATDSGTIVRRYGRLVDGNSISIPDYAVVSLNGGNNAAVVDITDAPDNSRIMLMRGRILSVDEGKSFKVQSMAVLAGLSWSYTPIAREFTIDHKTLFIGPEGYMEPEAFIGYTTESVVDKVYNIIIDGGRATHVVNSPYTLKSLKGTVYASADGSVSIKDAQLYDETTGKWQTVSLANPTAVINTHPNTLIFKNNQVIQPSGLVVGDQIRLMTDNLTAAAPGMTVEGYIIYVEK